MFKQSKLPVWSAIIILFMGFLLIFASLNLFKYFRVKRTYASESVSRLWKLEQAKINAFFSQIEQQLKIIQDLGKNGLLQIESPPKLNKRFLPLLENQKILSGLILADSEGREYFLYKEPPFWITRLSIVRPEGTYMYFQKWKDVSTPLKSWEEITNYDPRKRPWFKVSQAVHWSPVYPFYETHALGVTASVSWAKQEGVMVFGVDIPLSHFSKLLSFTEGTSPQITFLYNIEEDYFLLGQIQGPKDVKNLSQRVISYALQNKLDLGTISFEGKRWVFSLQKISPEAPFLLGVIIPEAYLMKELQKTLFHFAPVDIMVAFIGGALLVLIFWRTGGFRRFEGSTDPFAKLLKSLERGESSRIEFKSTVRQNLRTGKPGKEIELAWLKAVVAFLNSEGGTLFLGVDDESKILGVANDGFENLDKLQLHLKNLIHQHIGPEFSRYINVIPVEVDGHIVIMIECKPSKEPVFLKIGKNEEFYIRSGPSSVKLSPRQTISYVLHSQEKA